MKQHAAAAISTMIEITSVVNVQTKVIAGGFSEVVFDYVLGLTSPVVPKGYSMCGQKCCYYSAGRAF